MHWAPRKHNISEGALNMPVNDDILEFAEAVEKAFSRYQLEVDAETIANMQRCVDEYRELYPDSRD